MNLAVLLLDLKVRAFRASEFLLAQLEGHFAQPLLGLEPNRAKQKLDQDKMDLTNRFFWRNLGPRPFSLFHARVLKWQCSLALLLNPTSVAIVQVPLVAGFRYEHTTLPPTWHLWGGTCKIHLLLKGRLWAGG